MNISQLKLRSEKFDDDDDDDDDNNNKNNKLSLWAHEGVLRSGDVASVIHKLVNRY
jgi:hypothetical protein